MKQDLGVHCALDCSKSFQPNPIGMVRQPAVLRQLRSALRATRGSFTKHLNGGIGLLGRQCGVDYPAQILCNGEGLNQPVHMAGLSMPLGRMAGIRSPLTDPDVLSLDGVCLPFPL